MNIKLTCQECEREFDFDNDVQKLFGPGFKPQRCDSCQDIIIQQRNAEAAAEREQARASEWRELCPREFRVPNESGGLTDVARMNAEQPAWRKVRDFQFSTEHRALVVCGPSGTCKTRAVWRLIRREFEAGHRVAFFKPGDFDRQCRDAGGDFTLTEWFNDLLTVPLLVIDDLGKAAWTEATESQFCELLDRRSEECQPFVVTMNDTGDTLKARARQSVRMDALIRRLHDYCDVMIFQLDEPKQFQTGQGK